MDDEDDNDDKASAASEPPKSAADPEQPLPPIDVDNPDPKPTGRYGGEF